MKRMLAMSVVVLLLVVSVPVFAEVDLSGMSFDDLVALKDQINLVIWESDEWQEVTVPQGVYTVGEDIPVGHWTIKPAEEQTASVYWGDTLDASGRALAYGDVYESDYLYSETYRNYKEGDKTEVDYVLEDGQYIIIDSGFMVFSPYSGKPTLGFK